MFIEVPLEMEDAMGVSADAGVVTALDPSLYDSVSPVGPPTRLRGRCGWRRVRFLAQCCHVDQRSHRRQYAQLVHVPACSQRKRRKENNVERRRRRDGSITLTAPTTIERLPPLNSQRISLSHSLAAIDDDEDSSLFSHHLPFFFLCSVTLGRRSTSLPFLDAYI